MKTSDFEKLLERSESSTIDFKRCNYQFEADTDGRKTAEFVKDIISFSNTIRSESAFIILGVGVNEDGTKELIGLEKHIDDAILQDKIKNKVSPIPAFSYETIEYDNKTFGIIEIPKTKYPTPISPIVKMKGLEAGNIYWRRGSSNCAATGQEVILIFQWMQSLQDNTQGASKEEEKSKMIQQVSSSLYPLSDSISRVLQYAEKHNLLELKEFCTNELTGWYGKVKIGENTISYRNVKVVTTAYEIEIPSYYPHDSRMLLNEMKKDTEHFVEQNFQFTQPISEIEMMIKGFKEKENALLTLNAKATAVYEHKQPKQMSLKIYFNKDNLDFLYERIKQRVIELLINS